jgi:anaerobic selenocysteine-containing dehydrogenase
MILEMNLARNRKDVPPAVLEKFRTAAIGVHEIHARDLARELGESEAPLVIAGASMVHTNSLDVLLAAHYVNVMLGNFGKKGGVLPPAESAVPPAEDHRVIVPALSRARVVLIDGANPAYTLPRASGVIEALSRAGLIINFAQFVDDTAAWSDLLLPVHHALESEVAIVPPVSPHSGLTIGVPFVEPLYETRALPSTLAALAQRLRLDYQPATAKELAQPFLTGEATFGDAAREGGVWLAPNHEAATRISEAPIEFTPPAFDGDAAEYPMHFQPYLSLQFHDGAAANLPWMQELPDPASSAIWGLPVEIDPQTARHLQISNGDIVRVQSAHGTIEAPAYVHPGAIPGVLSMAIGDGHTHYGRYASGRGANPISILAPVWEKSTGALVLGGTRVRLARVGGKRDWIQFAAPDREEREFGHR